MPLTAKPEPAGKFLIVNADDLGVSPDTNAGIIEAFRTGIVTSASLMVDRPGTADAVRRSRDNPRLSIGLHLDLGEWCYRDGQWHVVSQPVPPDDPLAVRGAVLGQLERFQTLLGRPPTHLDSHQHVHQHEPAHGVALEVAEQLDIPLRGLRGGIAYCGSFYGQSGRGEPCSEAIRVDALLELLAALPAGVTELGCHPGLDAQLASVYRLERRVEVESLCAPAVREAVTRAGIRLVSFAEVSPFQKARGACGR
jgi:predicted glycoside hydrolase/deacetylase ChbG (UPF0249 family)